MINLIPVDAAGKPVRWVLAFSRTTNSWWVRLLACGRYKHVRAFGYVSECDAWVFFDLRFRQIDIWTARGKGASHLMAHYIEGCDLISMPVKAEAGTTFRSAFYCVPAIKHLIGLRSGALRPDGLWRDCLRNGGEHIAHDAHFSEPAAVHAAP